MSRSKKKFGVLKDKGLARTDYSKRIRRVNRQRVKLGLDPKRMNELVNQWIVCDWKHLWINHKNVDSQGKKLCKKDSRCQKMRRLYFGK